MKAPVSKLAWAFLLPLQLKTAANLNPFGCLEEDSASEKEIGQLLKKETQVSNRCRETRKGWQQGLGGTKKCIKKQKTSSLDFFLYAFDIIVTATSGDGGFPLKKP